MGLFKSRDKSRADVPASNPAQHNAPISPPASNSSYDDSNSKSASNISSAEHDLGKQPPATTTVNPDGTTQVASHPYDPAIDPPVSETNISRPTTSQMLLPTSENQQQSKRSQSPVLEEQTATPRRQSTGGGRPIPPRSELRSSHLPRKEPDHVSHGVPACSQPKLSQTTSSADQPQNQASKMQSTTSQLTASQTPASRPSYQSINGTASPASQASSMPNFSRPAVAPPLADSRSSQSGRGGLSGTLKGIRGAGEAIRGSVNSKIAKGLGEETELENSRMIREQGLQEYRGSGVETGIRSVMEKAGDRQQRQRETERKGVTAGHSSVGSSAR
ncbi:hypothetical protein FH972_024687 [Carpinus fangiana]|uniref:Uncharacterized protein n=1 Tax=Carpinus fangiana TaxID=176857 RepID=A0A5N6KYQ4_9ROSI|nr:hypothetical protein FH972_024687 [Carpinus fangiana]